MIRPLVFIPHYNQPRSLRRVVEECLALGYSVAVFDDGSTEDPAPLLKDLPIFFQRFEINRGKGSMILQAAHYAADKGYTHLVTIDADGQHNPQDIARLLEQAQQTPRELVLGVRKFDKERVPFASRFGRIFGGFWVHLQTGTPVADIQSGLRVYPLEILLTLPLWSKRYAFEVEVVVRALWGGYKIKETQVSVIYPQDRVSHFHVFKDNARLSVLNTYLTVRSMLPIPHRQYVPAAANAPAVKRGYWEVMIENLRRPHSAVLNARSAAWGIFCGSIALPGVRQVMLFMGAGWWNLNRLLAISFEKLCIGPIVPALCIEAGFFLRYGRFLTEFNLTTLGRQFLQRVWEWVIGSLVVAPLLAAVTFIIVWCVGKIITRGLHE